MATSRWKTAAALLNDAAVELGLVSAELADPFASADQNIVLLRRLLTSLGKKLSQRPALERRKEATITAAGGDTGAYSLPDDFVRLVDQTGWNRSTAFPLALPTSSQEWQRLKATGISGTVYIQARVIGDLFEVFEVPAVGTVIAVEYVSRAWVQPATSSEPDADECTVATDRVLFEPDLIVSGLKYRWKAAKNMPADNELSEFELALEVAEGARPAPVLDLAGPLPRERFIDGCNVPDTGYGQ